MYEAATKSNNILHSSKIARCDLYIYNYWTNIITKPFPWTKKIFSLTFMPNPLLPSFSLLMFLQLHFQKPYHFIYQCRLLKHDHRFSNSFTVSIATLLAPQIKFQLWPVSSSLPPMYEFLIRHEFWHERIYVELHTKTFLKITQGLFISLSKTTSLISSFLSQPNWTFSTLALNVTETSCLWQHYDYIY